MHYIRLSFFIVLIVCTSQPLYADLKTFVGVEAVNIDTNLDYADGDEDYEFTGYRLKIGADISDGAVVGIEMLTGDSDEVFDSWGTPYSLETDTAFGIFLNIGRPFYLKLGWSFWDSEYTNLDTSIVEKREISAMEYGLGFRLMLGSALSIYGDITKRNSDTDYPAHFIGDGYIEYDSVLTSMGLSISF
ncbi:MAG: hypothetical protein GY820_32875 [Gammaproteobacteria bacterium]|nr:hypothetical protein [Gammaproteobacteria bacterium]